MDLIDILQKLDKVCHQIYQVVVEVYMIIWIDTAIIQKMFIIVQNKKF